MIKEAAKMNKVEHNEEILREIWNKEIWNIIPTSLPKYEILHELRT